MMTRSRIKFCRGETHVECRVSKICWKVGMDHLARDALFEFGTGVSLASLSTHKETYPCTALKDQAHLHRLITTV